MTSEDEQEQNKPNVFALEDVLAGLISKYGVARKRSDDAFTDAWQSAAGDFADRTRVKGVRRGVVEVLVSDSVTLQELGFQKLEILRKLREAYPEGDVKDLRFRLGRLE